MQPHLLLYLIMISYSACASNVQTKPVSTLSRFLGKPEIVFAATLAAADSLGWNIQESDDERRTITAQVRGAGADSLAIHISLTRLKTGMIEVRISGAGALKDELSSDLHQHTRRSIHSLSSQ